LACWGWVRGVKGVKSAFNRIIDSLKIPLPRTETGDYVSKADELEPYKGNQFIKNYLDYVELEKAMSFVINNDSARVHPRYNILVNTGRTSCSSPNFQQLPRAGGIREMFVPEKGNVFITTDYSAIELVTLSQILLLKYGYSEMANMINDDIDLHKYYASVYYSKDIKDITKAERQSAKAANFGFPGGLGLDTFIQFSRGYDLDLDRSTAQSMKDAWFEAFPEIRRHMIEVAGEAITLTGRIRGNTTYCAEKNNPFQGLAADGAKIALWNLQKAGFKIVGFVHDEIITECKKEDAERLLVLQEKIMIDSMSIVTPDVKVAVESNIVDRYCK